MPRPPKPPKLDASQAEHDKFVKKVLDYDEYKKEPPGGVQTDDVVPDRDAPKEPEEKD